ncbi:Uncharacterised protein [Serratia quinivorans]|uniref:Uncharacterized protein n=1 Tax=Serratia quinivorans TaxID=137545 RepID=A0A379ZYJ7_9GAMM|nr:Uncharacterised protein [Serratia quinivorans]SUI69852.1 Uncharacterised protein [Serratia quinivorans]
MAKSQKITQTSAHQAGERLVMLFWSLWGSKLATPYKYRVWLILQISYYDSS